MNLASTANPVLETLEGLPMTAVIPAALLLITGIVFWFAGRKVMKAGFAAAGFLVGGVLGFTIGALFTLGVAAWITGLVGAVLFAALAVLTYRLMMAAGLALLLGIAAPLLVLAVNDVQIALRELEPIEDEPGAVIEPEIDPNEDDELTRWLERGSAEERARAFAAAEAEREAGERLRDFGEDLGLDEADFEAGMERAAAVFQQLREIAREKWAETPEGIRLSLVIACLLGALLGFLIGALSPDVCASAMTASGGAFLMLTAGTTLLSALGLPTEWIPAGPLAFLAAWSLLSVVGLALQWTILGRKGEKSASSS